MINLPIAATTREEYTSLPGLNYSGMKWLLVSPAHYQASLIEKTKSTKALRVGDMIHKRVLQPDVFSNFVKEPDIKKNSKEGKEAYAAFLAKLPPNAVLADAEEYDEALEVGSRMNLLLETKGVKSFQSEVMLTALEDGVPLKCSIDLVWEDNDGIWLGDLKSAESASPRGFKDAVKQYKYYLQNFSYLRIFELATGIKPKGFKFFAMEKKNPYASGVYQLGAYFMSYAVRDYYYCLKTYKACAELDSWPAYDLNDVTIDDEPRNSFTQPNLTSNETQINA